MAKSPSDGRKSPSSIRITPNVRCERVYPVEGSKRSIATLKTIGVRLNREQAIHLARVLLAVAQDWDDIDITAYRFHRRQSDGTHQVTVTTGKAPAHDAKVTAAVPRRASSRRASSREVPPAISVPQHSGPGTQDYLVTKKPDHHQHWWFQIYRRKLEGKALRGNARVVVSCDHAAPSQTVFAIPYDFLRDNVFPKAKLERNGRYMFEVRKDSHKFVFHPGVQFDGGRFLVPAQPKPAV
jgi:hypothetical protein